MGWTRKPTGFGNEVRDELSKQLRATSLQALSNVIDRSPVDTGAFRGNNIVSIGSADTSHDAGREDKSGASTLQAGSSKISSVSGPFEQVFIQNNLPYAEALEHGHSGQAPQGVYGLSFNDLLEEN